jgi:hypothetical protein
MRCHSLRFSGEPWGKDMAWRSRLSTSALLEASRRSGAPELSSEADFDWKESRRKRTSQWITVFIVTFVPLSSLFGHQCHQSDGPDKMDVILSCPQSKVLD